MPLWGNTDDAANSVISAAAEFKLTPNTANRTALFGNTTVSAIVSGQAVGQFGVDVTEMGVGTGPVIDAVLTFVGSGYASNTTVAFSANNTGASAAANATSSASGRISGVNITNNGSGYTTSPIITIAAPAAITFSGNTTAVTVGNSTVNGFISLNASRAFLVNNDVVTYLVGAGNTAIGGLANATQYYVITANSTAIQLSTAANGPAINLTSAAITAQAGHSFTGETATGVVTVGGAKNKGIAHAGWNIRKEGTGGRAGRVQYETLVAMSSISTDASDDTVLPDA